MSGPSTTSGASADEPVLSLLDSEKSAMEGQQQRYMYQHPGQEPPMDFREMVKAVAEAATMSLIAGLSSGTLRLPHNAPAPSQPAGTNENRSSDENQSETENSQPYQRTCPCVASA
jgi:hypothetical protein